MSILSELMKRIKKDPIYKHWPRHMIRKLAKLILEEKRNG